MKLASGLLVLLAVLAFGCTPEKSKACEGCVGSDLMDCERAYEDCDTIEHCRHTDIKEKYADNVCVGE